MLLELKQLKIDGGTQPRVAINEETVAEYAEALSDGTSFPPVVAFHEGDCWWLADGFHRYHAHRHAGLEKIEVDVREGTLRDAILFSVGANTEHGVRRTNEDKRKAVETMLTNEAVAQDDSGNPWSNHEIARHCKVSAAFVIKMRALHADCLTSNVTSENQGQPRAYTTKHGTKAVMKTSKIGRGSGQRVSGPAPISRDAHRPRPHSEDSRVPMRTISLPLNNPCQAAKSMLRLYGEDYIRKLITEFNQILENKEGAEDDHCD